MDSSARRRCGLTALEPDYGGNAAAGPQLTIHLTLKGPFTLANQRNSNRHSSHAPHGLGVRQCPVEVPANAVGHDGDPESRLRLPQQYGTAMGVDLLGQLGNATISPLGRALRFDRAPQQSGILGRQLAELTLHVGDDGTLFGDLFLHAADVVGGGAKAAGLGEILEYVAMVGIDGIAPDAGLPGKGRDGQPLDSL